MSLLPALQDTIYAIATPPGVGAIGVIRLSGASSFQIVNNLFPSKDLLLQKSHTIHVGFLKYENMVLDEVVLSLFKGPNSYTGEDVIEISCHGSVFIQQKIMSILDQEGARMAKEGEFTQRAFLNGKMDLAQAESVADLIAANSEASQQAAIKQLKGGFSQDLKLLREELINFAALIELELDFSQEDVEFADRTQLERLIDKILFSTQALLDSFKLGNVIKNGVSVAIIGSPNAGKSTLLNALLNEERAIVSDIAGTTRDTIEEVLNIDGVLFRLIDTAGIRENTNDKIEQIGVQKSLEKMRQADIVIYLFDASTITKAEFDLQIQLLENEKIKFIVVANKIDSADSMKPEQFNMDDQYNFVAISAKERRGIADLRKKMYDIAVQGELNTENTIISNARHEMALKKIVESLWEIKNGMESNLSGDLLTPDIHRCLHYLGEITGEVEVDRDILGTIFGKFCIGK
ncbi:MAG: tRNA uridine-5-carboxymethylaminomethyl(34) synthesis GTPase MnmE [Pseudopedobacter saltans]|uniref:tRNA modification GTPase MnmE n=1 Tax=Pseudopedobacter saltans TaxID=151895 RepID=A0A2W5ER73_9SPHI|nr:MAG: tRNA uridine-5-carboxymethylaminomethyl(34) synthesis GTPase MnmE [Pseudopedobacter saltans]